MAIRVAINGFGRIGRNILRAGWNNADIEFVHINDLVANDMLAYLLQHDTVHRRFEQDVEVVEGGFNIGGSFIPVSAERDPKKLPWSELKVDVVLECTGFFISHEAASAHIEAGARKVIISAPGKNVDNTIVVGVNHHTYEPASHHILSNASCTTNCLAPVVKTLHEAIGIEHGSITTIHAYTMDQNLLDAPHAKGKMRRARAAAQNMVPTSTGAAKAIALVYPALANKLDGLAIRVPTPDVSLTDLVFTASRPTTVDEVNNALRASAAGPMKGVLDVSDAPIVSSDLIGNPYSSIVDAPLTQVIGGTQVKVLSWYDNEWGFSNRMLDLAQIVAS